MIMKNRIKAIVFLWLMILMGGCASQPSPAENLMASTAETPETASTRDLNWFDMELTDAVSGETFTMSDFAGKVVLVETMAMWCPNCLVQANEVRKMHEALGNPKDLISVSLDVDTNEDAATLKKYVEEYGYDWRFAVAPLLVARALGNRYSAQYLNPPISPMLLIDREGEVHLLEYGFKSAEALQEFVEPFLRK
jgi:cytochrome oxidase Cu insertion factor (SCO1/SenC/PrrC family)